MYYIEIITQYNIIVKIVFYQNKNISLLFINVHQKNVKFRNFYTILTFLELLMKIN